MQSAAETEELMRSVVSLILFAVLLQATAAFAGSEALAREYVEKSGFVATLKASLEKVNPNGSNKEFDALLTHINFDSIKKEYIKALARELNNEELSALIKSVEIPHLHDALLKQGRASLSITGFIYQEVEAAAKRAGLRDTKPDDAGMD